MMRRFCPFPPQFPRQDTRTRTKFRGLVLASSSRHNLLARVVATDEVPVGQLPGINKVRARADLLFLALRAARRAALDPPNPPIPQPPDT